MIEISPEDHAELVDRLTQLKGLAEGLTEAFDDSQAETGAREMLASIDRLLEIARGAHAPE